MYEDGPKGTKAQEKKYMPPSEQEKVNNERIRRSSSQATSGPGLEETAAKSQGYSTDPADYMQGSPGPDIGQGVRNIGNGVSDIVRNAAGSIGDAATKVGNLVGIGSQANSAIPNVGQAPPITKNKAPNPDGTWD
jgi:hypothetical protein